MKFKMFAIAAALVLTPVAAQAAMECCKDCACCKDKMAEPAKPSSAPSGDQHKH